MIGYNRAFLGLIRQAFRINSIEAKRHLLCIHFLDQIRINALLANMETTANQREK